MDFENGIVNILTPDKKMSEGIGFFISKNKILTCYHVIENYPKNMPIYYQYLNSNIIYKAKFVKANNGDYYDMALLEVEIVSEYSKKIFQIFDEKALKKIMEEDPKATVDTCGVSRTGFISYANPTLVFKEPRKCLVQLGNFEEKMEHGFSGAPLLYHNKVIGMVKGFLRENKKIFYAIPTEKIIGFCENEVNLTIKELKNIDFLYELFDFQSYQKKLQEIVETIETHYIDINCKELKNNQKSSLRQYADEFLKKEQNSFLLILGEYGSGKSIFAYKYALELLNNFIKNNTGYIPIILKLNDYNEILGIEGLIKKSLQNYFKIEKWKELLERCNILLICDGYDEIKNTAAWKQGNKALAQIANITTNKTKVIITCRTNHFIDKKELNQIFSDSEKISVPEIGSKPVPKFQKVYICELDEEQVKEYIESYKDEIDASVEEIINVIKNTYDLTDLSKRPILLKMIIETLDEIVEESKKIGKVNAAVLYEKYINKWLDRQEEKNNIKMHREQKKLFCRDLAVKLYNSNKSTVSYDELSENIKNDFKLEDVENIIEFSHDIHSCSFLNSDGKGNFGFIHDSFIEYFYADYITANILECAEKFNKISEKNKVNSINKMIGKNVFNHNIYCFINDILNKSNKQEIIEKFMKYLKKCDLYSQVNLLSIFAKSGPNIAELLNSGEFGLIKKRFRYLHTNSKYYIALEGIDLSYSSIERFTYKKLDFSDITFDKLFFKDGNFVKCNFDGSNFKNTTFDKIKCENSNLGFLELEESCIFKKCYFLNEMLTFCSSGISQFQDCDFSYVIFEGCCESLGDKFEDCNFSDVRFKGHCQSFLDKFEDCNFSDVSFSEHCESFWDKFENCNFSNAIFIQNFEFLANKFEKCKFSKTRFGCCQFTSAEFESCDFSDTDLISCIIHKEKIEYNVKYSNGKFLNCNFSAGFISTCNLSDVVFSNCDFSATAFGRNKLSNVTFENCKFKETEFIEEHYNDCKFKNCDFSDESIYKSEFSNTTFVDCKLSTESCKRIISANGKIINQ